MVEARTRVRCRLDREESIQDIGDGRGEKDLVVSSLQLPLSLPLPCCRGIRGGPESSRM